MCGGLSRGSHRTSGGFSLVRSPLEKVSNQLGRVRREAVQPYLRRLHWKAVEELRTHILSQLLRRMVHSGPQTFDSFDSLIILLPFRFGPIASKSGRKTAVSFADEGSTP